ncbi:hypothetical protein C823_001184 [Eubacterium plexicaudatum ASF492]|nr:hypothetical protein C823_001184 [Eubacterium plexicaudatum ASF492]
MKGRQQKSIFQKYRVLTNNHPTYWEDLEKSIIKLYPDANFVSIVSVRSAEDLIKADQGVSYLSIYIVKGLKQSGIKLVEPNPDKPEKILQFLHISSTIKKNVGGCVHVTYR